MFLCCTANGSIVIASEISVPTDESSINKIILHYQQQAENLHLAQHETWLALLHYKRETIMRRFISQADDDRFFLDINGKEDAHAELMTAISAFLQPAEKNHAQCRFPARWWWLKQQLNISDNVEVSCPTLDKFINRISNHRLFLVFPSMYLNNPGSTFGHTFLRFDDEDGSILLSPTLNYAAGVDHSDGLMRYVSKGLSGGYKGVFRARPYFETVQEYSNIENRDIWEYQLDFTADEITQLVRHVWEVKDIDFDYYFFRENCAYRLLALLDVVRPGLKLSSENKFPVYTIPVDTVRALEDAGLIIDRTFRASLATQIDDSFYNEHADVSDLVMLLVSEQTAIDKQAFNEALSMLDSTTKLKVLQQSYNILQFQGESSSQKARLILQMMNELSEISQLAPIAVIDTDKHSPETGHDSIGISIGYGEQNTGSYLDIKFRPAFHDLLDSPQGYVGGAAINVFETRFKWFANDDGSGYPEGSLRLESLSLFNVTSLSSLSRWQSPLSWMFDFRFDHAQPDEAASVRNFISRGGIGASFRHEAITPFVFLTGEWQLASAYTKGYSLLFGLQAGVLMTLHANQLLFSFEKDDSVSGFEMNRSVSQLQWQYNLKVNHALRMIYRRIGYNYFNDEDWSLSYQYYF